MAEFSGPFTNGDTDGGPWSVATWWRLFRALLGPNAQGADVGFVRGYGDEGAASIAGADRIDFETAQAFVRGTLYENDATIEVDENANRPTVGTTGKRLVLRRDAVDGGIRLTVIRSADGTATLPALTQVEDGDYDIPCWSFTHATDGTIAALTDEREFIEIGGGGMKRSINGGAYLLPAAPSQGSTVTQSASANTYGAWVQMEAAAAADFYVVGFRTTPTGSPPSATTYAVLDIGVGGGGSEVSRGEFPARAVTGSAVGLRDGATMLPAPIFVPAGSRTACRIASSVANADTYAVTLICVLATDLETF